MPASLGTGASFTLKPFQIQVFREKESVNDIIQKGERGWENGKKRERRRNDNRCLEMLVSLQFLLYWKHNFSVCCHYTTTYLYTVWFSTSWASATAFMFIEKVISQFISSPLHTHTLQEACRQNNRERGLARALQNSQSSMQAECCCLLASKHTSRRVRMFFCTHCSRLSGNVSTHANMARKYSKKKWDESQREWGGGGMEGEGSGEEGPRLLPPQGGVAPRGYTRANVLLR